ncbi:MAG TPA: xanthine dehydrogenase family protein molybdopterin-binding subunit [Chloroflexota bacterium]|nr:xanthine dehydrogenase family protein molybdopterin-binding subunit [Chloroflexota bacterium]
MATADWQAIQTRWMGTALKRKEDPRLLTGQGRFLDDIKLPGMLHAAFVRSPHAHARVLRVDASAARALPGVYAVLTGAEARERSGTLRPLIPVPTEPPNYCLASDKVRYVGEPLAIVAAVDRATAEDAAALVAVEYEELPAVVDVERAVQPDAPLVYEEVGSNVLWHDVFEYGDVEAAFAAADEVVAERFTIHRYASTPLECFGVIADWDAGQEVLTIWTNDQRPGLTIGTVAEALRLSEAQIHLITPDIGGGFGNKRRPAYIVAVALLAMATGRPVKYLEDRRENLMALMHACNGVMYIEAAVRRDGTVLGLKVRDYADEGTNLISPCQHSLLKLGNMVNTYRIPAVRFEPYSVLTNKCPSGANRGIGKPFMCFAIERLMDRIAERLGLDPAELRFRNFIPPDQFPYETPTGAYYDSGNFPETLRRALRLLDYDALRREQARARAEGRYLGIGISTAVEPASSNLAAYMLVTGKQTSTGVGEAAMVRVEPDGKVRVAFGDVCSGQGYETAAAQLVADELGLHPDDVHVHPWFDSFTTPWLYSSGNYANKFATTDVGAILGAARKVKEKILTIAAHLLEAAPEDLELRDGRVRVRGVPSREKALREIAQVAYRNLLALPPGLEPGLEARHFYANPVATLPEAGGRVRGQLIFTNAAHIALVEVDIETAQVKVLRYGVVHDCGRAINPLLVAGQVHGATVHGIGAALLEEFVYDENGQLLTTTFMDYLKPTASDVPTIETDHLETPSPFTPLGTKGVGEGGAIPAPACIANAVEDALRPLGVRIDGLPLSPSRLWTLLQRARQGAA